MKTQDFSQSGEKPLRVLTVRAAQLLGHYAPQPPAVGRGLGMERAWGQHCSFSERCLGHVPCLFLGEAAVPSLAPSGEAAVLQQRSHCLSHRLQEGELPPGGTMGSLKFSWKEAVSCLALCEEPARPPGQAGMSSA